jgi:hypothetical protein
MTSTGRFPRACLGGVLSACTLTGSFSVRGTPPASRARHFRRALSPRALARRSVGPHTLAVRTLTW